jgi:hypothetical protein
MDFKHATELCLVEAFSLLLFGCEAKQQLSFLSKCMEIVML